MSEIDKVIMKTTKGLVARFLTLDNNDRIGLQDLFDYVFRVGAEYGEAKFKERCDKVIHEYFAEHSDLPFRDYTMAKKVWKEIIKPEGE